MLAISVLSMRGGEILCSAEIVLKSNCDQYKPSFAVRSIGPLGRSFHSLLLLLRHVIKVNCDIPLRLSCRMTPSYTTLRIGLAREHGY